MSDAKTKVEAFFAGAERWQDELQALREILLACPVTEEFKWRAPCYTCQGGNVATVWALKDSCALAFFKGVLLTDPEGILTAPGEHSRSMRVAKFTSVAEISERKDVLAAYVREAAEAEKAGLKVDFPKDDLAYPEELVQRLEEDPEFQAAFEALTPGRRRGYVLHFSGAKQAKTRESRIEKCAPRILDGKGLHDR